MTGPRYRQAVARACALATTHGPRSPATRVARGEALEAVTEAFTDQLGRGQEDAALREIRRADSDMRRVFGPDWPAWLEHDCWRTARRR